MIIEPKLACVIDRNGVYVDLVLVNVVPDSEGDGTHEEPYGYQLREGETLVPRTEDCRQPTPRSHAGDAGFIRPKWDGATWTEGATSEEVAAWETAHPAPAKPKPTQQEDSDALLIDHEYRLTLLELGVN